MSSEQDLKKAEKAARERYEQSMEELREATYRFASRIRGQAAIVVEELIDPEGEAVAALAEVEGDAGALALSMPLDLITFETWLFGQIGDQEELDLNVDTHWQLWFNFGAWIGETLRRRHGGYWLTLSDEPKTWRLGFSKIMLEVAPFLFAEQLLRLGQGAVHKLVSEIERIRQVHEEQKERDGGQDVDRFLPQHYIRMHTMPLGQWMVMDFALLERLWNHAAARDLIKELKKAGARLGPANEPLVTQIIAALEKADQNKPVSQQGGDRGLFEAVAQIVTLRRASAPIAMDLLEGLVLPSVHIGYPESFPPLDEDDLANLRQGLELYAFFVDVVPHKHQADDTGFLRSIPTEDLASPYGGKTKLELGRGDWVIINPRRMREMLADFDPNRLLSRYDEFVAYVRANPNAPQRRDDGRPLAETVLRALVDLKGCVAAASKEGHVLLFRMLPPPG